MKRLAGRGLFLVVGLVAACSGRKRDDDSEFLYPTEESFCTALGEAECNQEVVEACYGSDASTLLEDTTSCVAARSARCNPLGLPYHPEAAEGCITARQAALEDAVWNKDEIAAVETACLPVLSKEGAEAATCGADHDCNSAGGLKCIIKFGYAAGVCGVPVVMAGGEGCADPLEVCGDTFYCDSQVVHCLAKPALDEPCSAAAPCDEGFYCTDSEVGKCLAKTKNGLACQKDALCAGGFCVGATADVDGVCSSTFPLQITGDSCTEYR